jgi:WD40 repeat protein
MSFSADGTRMIVPDGFSATARLWDLAARQPLFSISGQRSRIDRLQLSPDGALILSSSPNDPNVRLWDGATGTLKSEITLSARDVELSTDGRYLLATSDGKTGLYLVRFDELVALARTRVTRPLTCEEERDFLHNPVECFVPTPRPVSS